MFKCTCRSRHAGVAGAMLLASHAALAAAACGALALAAQGPSGLLHSVDSVSSAVITRTARGGTRQQARAISSTRPTYDLSHRLPKLRYSEQAENASLAAVVGDAQLLLLKDEAREAKSPRVSALLQRAQHRFDKWSEQLDGPRGSESNLIYKNLCDIQSARIDVRGDGTKQTVKDIFEEARAQNADFSLFTSVRNLGPDRAVEKAVKALQAQLEKHCGVEIKYLKSVTAVSVASAATARSISNRNTELALRCAKNRDAHASSLEAAAAETAKAVLSCLQTIYSSRDKALVDYSRKFTQIVHLKQSPASICPKEVLVANVFNAMCELRVVLKKTDDDWKASMLELDKSASEYGKIVSSLYSMHPPNYNLTPCFSANDNDVCNWEDKIHQVIDSLHAAAKKVAGHMQAVLAFTRIYYVFIGWLEMLVNNFWTLVSVPDPLIPMSSTTDSQTQYVPPNAPPAESSGHSSAISAAPEKKSRRKKHGATKLQLVSAISSNNGEFDDDFDQRADREVSVPPLKILPQDLLSNYTLAFTHDDKENVDTGWQESHFDMSALSQFDRQSLTDCPTVPSVNNITEPQLNLIPPSATDAASDKQTDKSNQLIYSQVNRDTFNPTEDEINAGMALWGALSKPGWTEEDRTAVFTHITVVIQKPQKQMEKVFELQCKTTKQRKALESEGLATAQTIKSAASTACHVHLSSLSIIYNKSKHMQVSNAKNTALLAGKTVFSIINQLSDTMDRLLISGTMEQSLMCVLALLTQSKSFFTDAKTYITAMRQGDTIAKGLCAIAEKSDSERLLHLKTCTELDQAFLQAKADLDVVLDACKSWNDVMEKMSALTSWCFEVYENDVDEKALNVAISKCQSFIHTILSYEPSQGLYCQRQIAFLALQLKHVVTQYRYELCVLADTHEKVLTKLVQIPFVDFLSLVPQELQ